MDGSALNGVGFKIAFMHMCLANNAWKIDTAGTDGKSNSDLEGVAEATTQATAEWWEEIKLAVREVYIKQNQFEPAKSSRTLLREEYKHMQRPLWVTQNLLTVNAPVFQEKREARKS